MAEEEQPRLMPGYTLPAHSSSSNIIFMTNPEEELRKLELTFRNQIEDGNGSIVKLGSPLMNETGITVIVGMVRSVVNQNTVMTNLNKDDIPRIMLDFCNNLNMTLMVKYRDYGLERENRGIIKSSAKYYAFLCLKRALEQGERIFWKGSQQEITATYMQQQQNKGGIFSKILGWGQNQTK